MPRGSVAGALLGLLLSVSSVAHAAPDEDAAFKKRLLALKQANQTVVIKMGPKDDPNNVPVPQMGSGVVLVAGHRSGIYTPPLIEPTDILSVVNQNMKDVRSCYKKQLEEDPEWSEELIVDLAVKKTGRVSEISIAPGRVKRATIGQCLMSMVPKWKFPEFTGETDDGVTQEVVTASFPFSFSTK